jgi:LmbE family N-acetylglucosaminyl deacetylase
MTDQQPLKLLILGAHPDDAEFHAGGLATIYRALGHEVRMIAVTDGAAGHHQRKARELRKIRKAEAAASGSLTGAVYETWEFPDGHLQPTLEVRDRIIAEIRTYRPDLVLTHRTSDYHPDHRAVGQAVQDASFLVTVPLVVPKVPALRRDPVVAYMADLFTRPCPLRADVVLDITDRIDGIVKMLACHRSQVFEWLPYNQQMEDQVPPAGEIEGVGSLFGAARIEMGANKPQKDSRPRLPGDSRPVTSAELAWLTEWYTGLIWPRAERFRQELIAAYGPERGAAIEYCEVYEISEYAAPLDDAGRKRLFPAG